MTLEQIYLEYVNNYLTVAKMAEHYGIDESLLNSLINEVRPSKN